MSAAKDKSAAKDAQVAKARKATFSRPIIPMEVTSCGRI